jgi:calcium-dependent protein kinase
MGCASIKTGKKASPSQKKSGQLEVSNADNVRFSSGNFVTKKAGGLRLNYTISAKIGSGAFGYVRLAVHKDSSQKRAVKTIDKESITKDMKERTKFFNEVDILRRADHPNIIRLYEFYEDEKHYHLVTEYVGGGELFDFIIKSKMLSESIAANFMKQILSAVAYCHQQNIVHRDLKPENLLLDRESSDATVKVIDFGTSAIFEETKQLTQKYGTAYYIAPEVLRRDYNEKCDIWSCGVILYIFLSGRPPFGGKNDKDILTKVQQGTVPWGPEWEKISPEAKRLIKKMLEYDPKHRYSAAQALQDPWIISNSSSNHQDNLFEASSLEKLKGFRVEQKLQHAVLTFIASQLINKEESKKLAETFRSIDKNGDGKLSKEELLEAYNQTMGREEAAEEVEKIMKSVDVNGSGFIDYTEFVTSCAKKETMLSVENLESAFKAFDSDGSGKISATELREMLGGEANSQNEVWIKLIDDVDQDKDGEIDIREFKDMMVRYLNINSG